METTFYERNMGNYTVLAKIEHDNGSHTGYRYEKGKWVKWRYIETELLEDTGFDIISEEEAKKLMKELD